MPDENSPTRIELDNRIVTYLETLLNRINLKSGWGAVTIRVSNGRIAYIDHDVSEKWNQEERVA